MDAETRRSFGIETTWALQAMIIGEWVTFTGLFCRTLEELPYLVERNKACRPDVSDWRVIDLATGEILL